MSHSHPLVRFAGLTARHYFTTAVLAISSAFIALSGHAAETVTYMRAVPSIQVNTSIYGYGYYLYNPAGWGAPGCTNATYIQILTSEPGAKELLMVATLAHTTGKNINVWGECLDSNFMRGKAIQIAP